MPNIQITPLDSSTATQEQVAIINAAAQVYPAQSTWQEVTAGDLSPASTVPARMGSWICRVYSPTAGAALTIANIDLQPDPHSIFPDTHWLTNGLDIIPRST